jgi:prefoldin subunit 5
MAEDFYSAFTLGLNDKGIAVTDTAGVAFAAIQGLYRELEKKNDEIRQLQEQMSELAARFDALQSAKP